MHVTTWVLLWYAAVSAVTFVAYGLDKRAAGRNRWRIPERRLHGLELLGGFPGGVAGRAVFRHKRRKRRFRLWSWLIVAVHGAGWAAWWWLTAGRSA